MECSRCCPLIVVAEQLLAPRGDVSVSISNSAAVDRDSSARLRRRFIPDSDSRLDVIVIARRKVDANHIDVVFGDSAAHLNGNDSEGFFDNDNNLPSKLRRDLPTLPKIEIVVDSLILLP